MGFSIKFIFLPFIILSRILDPHLCSHMYALCFMAESLFDKKKQLQAKRCTEVCPHLSVFQLAKTFNAPDHSNIHSNSIDNDVPENIVFGMNISHRYKSKIYFILCRKSNNLNGKWYHIFLFPL